MGAINNARAGRMLNRHAGVMQAAVASESLTPFQTGGTVKGSSGSAGEHAGNDTEPAFRRWTRAVLMFGY